MRRDSKQQQSPTMHIPAQTIFSAVAQKLRGASLEFHPLPFESQPLMSHLFIEPLDPRHLLSSIAGLWTGSRTENGLTGTFATVTMNLALTQHSRTIHGTEHRNAPTDSEYFANLTTGGTLVGTTFSMQDQSLGTHQGPSNYTWLLYTATLTLSPSGQTLTGPWHSHGFKGTITLQRVPLPQITLGSAHETTHDSILLHYSIATANITQPLLFQVYRSRVDHLTSSSVLIGSQTLSPKTHADKLTIGSHRLTLLKSNSLTGDKTRPWVIIVANANGKVIQSAASIDSLAFLLHSF
jgi:hypothetical protein